jgi:uncharacterized MAPEG superfamily protein
VRTTPIVLCIFGPKSIPESAKAYGLACVYICIRYIFICTYIYMYVMYKVYIYLYIFICIECFCVQEVDFF